MKKILELLGAKTEEEAIAIISNNADLMTNAQIQAARVPVLKAKITEQEATIKELNETIVNTENALNALSEAEFLPRD
jgi:hypothetical protein